jgi:radical SAM protein with 4Fe4S-binding SPASM domain
MPIIDSIKARFNPAKIRGYVEKKTSPDRYIKKPPERVDLEITNVCDFNCSVCSAGNGKMNRPKKHLGYQAFCEILQKFEYDGLKNINVSCVGEPFLNPDIYKILKALDDLKVNVNIPTNASCIDISKLTGLSKNIMLNVSLDGVNYDAYAGYRGISQAKYQKSISTIEKLAQAGVNFKLSTLVSRFNENSLGDVQEFADKIGIPLNFKHITCSPFGVTKEQLPEGISLTDNWVSRKFVTKEDFHNLAPTGKRLKRYAFRYQFSEELDLYVDKAAPGKTCPFVRAVWITSSGDILPCCLEAYFNTIDFGNIFDQSSFKEIWLSKKYLLFRKGMLNVTQSDHGPCRICRRPS